MSDSDTGDDTDQYAQLEPEDTLADTDLDDVLDEGYSPPERAWNDRDHESLDERLADEIPDPWNTDDPEEPGADATRAGRLTVDAPSYDGTDGGEEQLVAGDAGVDGAGASAEEAAVHEVDEEE